MFAARAGAKHVYAVDASSGVIPFARSNIKENGFEDKITVILCVVPPFPPRAPPPLFLWNYTRTLALCVL